MENKIAELTQKMLAIKGCRFASLTYLSKSSGELARFTANFGFSYHEIVEKSKTELEILMVENDSTWTDIQKEAAAKIMASLTKTLEAHSRGEQNENYTKKGQYISLGNGVNINIVDNSIQLFGLVKTKVVLNPGQYKQVNSSPVTIERRRIEKLLPIGNFREFALDIGNVEKAVVNGDTIELSV